jgi:hypothetical protein
MSPQAELVAERLEQTWQRWWWFSFLTGALLAVAVSGGLLLVFVAADTLLHLGQLALCILFGVWSIITLGLAVALVIRTRRARRTLEATARRLEMEFPELESHLINLVQLSEEKASESNPFYRAAVKQAATAIEDVPFEQAARKKTRRERFVLSLQTPRDLTEAAGLLGIFLAACLGLSVLFPQWSSSFARLLHPWKFVPAVGSVRIVEVTPGDTEVLIGASLTVTAQIINPDHQPHPATLFIRRADEPETAVPLLADEDHEKFTAALPQVLGPLQYRLEIGDSQSPLYKVGVCAKPTIAEVLVTYRYPRYLNRADETQTQKHADLEGPQFTLADLAIHASTPITSGYLMIGGHRNQGWVQDERILRTYVFLNQTTTCTIHLFNAAGHTDPEPRVNQVRVLPDEPPSVQLVEPARETSVAAGGKTAVVIRAGDDHGLGRVWLEMRMGEDLANRERSETPPAQTVASWDQFPAITSAVLKHSLELNTARFKPGQVVFIRAVARDRRDVNIDRFGIKLQLGPQESATAWCQIRILSPEAKVSAELAQLDSLRAAVGKILLQQTRARVAVSQAGSLPNVAEEVHVQQIEVQKSTIALVQTIGANAMAEEITVKRTLNKLALGDMVKAVQEAEALARVKAVAEQAKPLGTLTATQDRILDVLRRLLNDIHREETEKLAELEKRPNNQLPNDIQDKLRQLRDKMGDLLKQQKKVIEASENLAKMPVEDCTDKEKQLLKNLAATEDDWARFLADAHSDLSKLPEQDFSNPSLLAEMVELQTQLKMAADALTKKSADIAVPLEQLGAEMAKEITSNIEKWLPDTPDRERWSQEEPLTDAMKEAPMAELPKELEDIIGELMENEEDLFDEMEDVSSSWADSLDKGAGWDAADGPISNNSAKGVTGNRLPNTSEIAGRSGEGRSGKSSGEFVGDTAVGKGGRKTPTRLTPDAKVQGQVKDHSKDPTGGATGGGKESGQGGEGLQGPVGKQPERQLERLANKQAELRNKAESIDLQFKVSQYHRTDLKKMIDAMAAVEQDLRSGRYQNALRRRDVMLQGLNQVKTYLQGEMSIRQDGTANLPTDIQKEILGSMHEASPQGWDRLNQQYFERLAGPRLPGQVPQGGSPEPGKGETPPTKETPATGKPK